ncbi:MAG: 5-(carboxyamino)imidazole ribonucleotide mutase, partial [Acidimicrobiales bacterium]
MKVAVLMGSPNDADKMKGARMILERFGIEVDERVSSAHRNPNDVAEFATTARDQGFGVIICGAGMACALPGAVAAHTTLPVIGVPLSNGPLNGIDALYATIQMPRG